MIVKTKVKQLIPLFFVGFAIVQVLNFLLNFIIIGRINTELPILVELKDGTNARVAPLPPNQRSPTTIKRHVKKYVTKLTSWSGTSYQNATPQFDKGVKTKKGRVTTSAFEAGFAFSEDFRAKLLESIAESTPESVFEGKTQSMLVIKYLSQPKKIAEGRWQLQMVANLVMFQGGKGVGKPTSFNRDIFVRAIEPPLLPKKATKLQQQMYKARKSGLEIYLMEVLK